MKTPPLKHHSLTGRINPPLMYAAFRAVKRNKGKAGVDRVSIELFARQLDQNLAALMRDLKDGSFEPAPVLPTRKSRQPPGPPGARKTHAGKSGE